MNILKFILQKFNKLNQPALAVFCGLLILTTTNVFAHYNHPTEHLTENNLTKPRAEFKQIWVDYDVSEGGVKGMKIHVKFSTYEMKGINSYMAIYFMDRENNKLRDKNGKMNSSNGEVAVYREMTPQYDPADYDDLWVFMPYGELDLTPGNYELRMDVDLIYKAGGLIQHLTIKDFDYQKPGVQADKEPQSQPQTQDEDQEEPRDESSVAKVNRIWVDYNATQGGRKGMMVHLDFEVSKLKGSDIMIAVRIVDEEDEFLKSKSAGFSNEGEQFEVNYPLKPGYDTTVYDDATIFVPFNEIIIGKGTWDLRLDIDLEYESHQYIEHLGFHEFEFKRQA